MSDPIGNARRRAAATALGVDPGAGSEEARIAFLRRLGESDLVPPPSALAAAAEFGVVTPGPEHDAFLRADVERDLAATVERFADAYWDLDPADRRARWSDLVSAAGESPRLVARLNTLSAGLDAVPPAEVPDPVDARLIELVFELYPRKAADRVARRIGRLPGVGPQHRIRIAARSVRWKYPVVRLIDHGWLEELDIGWPPVKPIRTPPEVRPKQPDESVRDSGGGSHLPWWIIIPICVSCIGALGRMSRDSTDGGRNNYSYPTSHPRGIPDLPPSARNTKAFPGLTRSQVGVLRDLARRENLSDAEITNKAIVFRGLGSTGPSFRKLSGPDGEWVVTPDTSFSPEQQRIQDRLARDDGKDFERIRSLLVEFVKAGRPASKTTDRP